MSEGSEELMGLVDRLGGEVRVGGWVLCWSSAR